MKRFAVLVVFVLLAGCGGGGGGSAGGGGQQQQQLVHRSATVPNIDLIAPKQNCTEDCWAACCEAVVRSFGISSVYGSDWTPATQDWFGTKMFGAQWPLNCQPASPQQIVNALGGAYANRTSNVAMGLIGVGVVGLPPYPPDLMKSVIQTIKDGHPVIIGLQLKNGAGHAVLISKLEWDEDTAGNIVALTSASIQDPWPYDKWGQTPLPTTLTDDNFNNSGIATITAFLGAVPSAPPSGTPPPPPPAQ